MAKSIYEILDDLQTETSVPGSGMVAHTLPRDLLPTAEQFENADELLAWAQDAGVTHACLQKGVQKMLIELRATFKACKKDETWSEAKGQAAVDGAKWTITNRPNVNSKEAAAKAATLEANTKTAQAMKAAGVDDATILTILTNACGAEMAKEIIKTL
jgi:hypothetical protein